MPKRTRPTAKSSIYSPDIVDLPTPVVSPSPLLPSGLPPLVVFSPEPEPEPEILVDRHDIVTTAGDDAPTASPVEDDAAYRPLSPLLLQETEPPGDTLFFEPPEEPMQAVAVVGAQAGHTRSPVLARYVEYRHIYLFTFLSPFVSSMSGEIVLEPMHVLDLPPLFIGWRWHGLRSSVIHRSDRSLSRYANAVRFFSPCLSFTVIWRGGWRNTREEGGWQTLGLHATTNLEHSPLPFSPLSISIPQIPFSLSLSTILKIDRTTKENHAELSFLPA